MLVPTPHGSFAIEAAVAKQPVKRGARKVPEELVRETIAGIPFYWQGYKQVLNQTKSLEAIMADSGLQAFLKKYFYDLLLRRLNPEIFEVYMGEVGAHLEHRHNFGLDVAVFATSDLTGEKFDFKYLEVVPQLVIEVDMKVSLDGTGLVAFEDFLSLKTQNLFNFGTKKLLWVLSKSKKVIVATPGEDWKIVDWNKDIEVWEGISINIGKHLKARGINPDIIL